MRFKIRVKKGGEEVEGRFIADAVQASGHANVELLLEDKDTATLALDAETFAQVIETINDLPDELVNGWENGESIS